jgi:hypothetical protein
MLLDNISIKSIKLSGSTHRFENGNKKNGLLDTIFLYSISESFYINNFFTGNGFIEDDAKSFADALAVSEKK